MAVDSIGSFQFVRLSTESGDPPKQTTDTQEDIKRPGVDGIAIRLNGASPEPFTMLGVRDVLSPSAAKAFLTQYNAAARTGPLELTWDGVSWGYYVILGVELLGLRPQASAIGGFHGSLGTRWMTVRFRLIAVEV